MTHKTLEAWKESINLVVKTYKLTLNFPKEEMYGLVSQIRRSAVSIPSNIAEGCARQTSKETIQFLHISLGSLSELETQVIIAKELNFLKEIDETLDNIKHIKKLIVGLIKFFKTKE